jgi:endonuclease/exonuclease/phosphatase family metal-dependent hydrolase
LILLYLYWYYQSTQFITRNKRINKSKKNFSARKFYPQREDLMKGFSRKTLYFLCIFFLLFLSHHFSQDLGKEHKTAIDSFLSWYTFLGSSKGDFGQAIVVDPKGNIYVAGWSEESWGKPINPHAGDKDAVVAKLDSKGELQWHTFLGSSGWDEGRGIAVDGKGNVYIVGTSEATWGTPVHPHQGDTQDAFAAKLNPKGELKWNTFMGGSQSGDEGTAITVDLSGNVYVGSFGGASWNTPPVNPISCGTDGWVTKLNSGGVKQWYTSMGAAIIAGIGSIAVNTIGDICIAGWSGGPFFSRPINPYSGGREAFAAKLNSNGRQQWHTFLGSTRDDDGRGIAIDDCGNIFISGTSNGPWGRPINSYAGKGDFFVAKLNSRGVRQWNTFLGSRNGGELGWAIAADTIGNVYAAGVNGGTWGKPFDPYAGHAGFYVAKLNFTGALLWNTFTEAVCGQGNAIFVDTSGNITIGGGGDVPWGTPVNPHTGSWDVFVAKIDRGIRVVSWNVLNYPDLNDDNRDEDIRKVMEILEPDILVVQEMESAYGVGLFLENVLNYKSGKRYSAAEFYDGPDSDNALFFDRSKLNLSSQQQIPTSFRDVSEFSLTIKKGPSQGVEFKIYSVHFTEGRSSSDKEQRVSQANTLRTHLNGLPLNSAFLVCGTFNITSSKEKGYKILTESQPDDIGGNIGRVKDLINKSGDWYNKKKFKAAHTESTRKIKFGGGAGGGLDDRYDMILVSSRLDQNGVLTYMPGSYVVCGNDGKHLNNSINQPDNNIMSPEIADALYKASDHLPVIIDLVSLNETLKDDGSN